MSENYSEDVTARMVGDYEKADSDESRAQVVANYADELGKTPASVRQKLVREGVYIAKTRKTKNGQPVERKADIVRDIAQATENSEDVLESLEKATKKALQIVRAALTA